MAYALDEAYNEPSMNTIGGSDYTENSATRPLESVVKDVERLLSRLEEDSKSLSDRLQSVLAPDHPRPEESAKMQSVGQSPIIGVFRQMTIRMDDVHNRLQSIIQRIEV